MTKSACCDAAVWMDQGRPVCDKCRVGCRVMEATETAAGVVGAVPSAGASGNATTPNMGPSYPYDPWAPHYLKMEYSE